MQNNSHNYCFRIKLQIDGVKRNLFLKLYNNNDYNPICTQRLEIHKGHNEFLALEKVKELSFKVIPAHFAFTNIKSINKKTILKSGIVYDFTNLKRLDSYLADKSDKTISDKHLRIKKYLEDNKVRDAYPKNVFIDTENKELYFFDLFTTDIDFES